MALKTKFRGKSSNGNLEDAIQDALKKAKVHFRTDFKWEVLKIAENQLTFPPLSVLIRIGGGKGDGGIGPKKPA